MTGWPAAPVIHEIDTWPWLHDVRRLVGRPVTLADVPDEVWRDTVPAGADAVWLMGVWERSAVGVEVARRDTGLQQAFRTALPDLRDGDLVGSPYCVRRYVVDARLGGPQGLAAARARLARMGLLLVLDHVPNHVAPDHPAITAHPEYFITGTDRDLAESPQDWLEAGGRVLARGRDPYFPPWPDVVQLNAFDPSTRAGQAAVLVSIGNQCDGVRCDMAMLLTNEVFARTWGHRVGGPPAEEFWPTVLQRVRAAHPRLLMVAEAYWDTEWTLQHQGFDLCYDKRLYDRLVRLDADAVRAHLRAGVDYQHRLLRFTENHDEPRAAQAFPAGSSHAAAVAVATLPGGTLWHDGQLQGRRVRLPVFLGRRPDEPVDSALQAFSRKLIAAVARTRMRAADWTLLDVAGWPDNPTHDHLLAWAWHRELPGHVVVVNLSERPSQGRVALPWNELRGRCWRLTDLLDDQEYVRDGDELAGPGLFVDLPPWGGHLLAVRPADDVR